MSRLKNYNQRIKTHCPITPQNNSAITIKSALIVIKGQWKKDSDAVLLWFLWFWLLLFGDLSSIMTSLNIGSNAMIASSFYSPKFITDKTIPLIDRKYQWDGRLTAWHCRKFIGLTFTEVPDFSQTVMQITRWLMSNIMVMPNDHEAILENVTCYW